MEVVLPADMNVRDSHDISLDLQHKVTDLLGLFAGDGSVSCSPCVCVCVTPSTDLLL
jgi:hypothetical protein